MATQLNVLYTRQNEDFFISEGLHMYPLSTNDAKLARPLMGLKQTGKVRNRRVPKSRLVLIINLGRTFNEDFHENKMATSLDILHVR